MSVEAKREDLKNIREQIEQIDPSSQAYATLKKQEADLEAEISDMKSKAQRQEIEQKQEEQGAGLKAAIQDIHLAIWPESVEEQIGLNEYAEKVQDFNRETSEIIDDYLKSYSTFVATIIEQKDNKFSALNAQLAESEAKIAAMSDYEALKARVAELETENAEIEGLRAQVAAKDEQIEKLNATINEQAEPKIILPGQVNTGKPLQERLDALRAKNDVKIKTSKELVLERFGIVPPPLIPGGSEAQDSFRDEDTAANDTDREGTATIPAMEVSQFPTEDEADGLGEYSAVRQDDAAVTRAEFEALKERVAKIEQGEVKEAA